MAAVVGDIAVNVTADIGPLVREMGRGEGVMNRFGATGGRLGRALDGVGSKALALGKGIAIVGAAVTAAVGSMVALAASAAGAIDDIGDAAAAAGVSTKYFQEMGFAMKSAAELSESEFQAALTKLSRTLGEAQQGSKTAIKAFEQIGISQADIASGTVTTESAFDALTKKLSDMKDPALAAAVATDLLGKSGAAIGTQLAGSGSAVDDLRKRAQDLGVALSGETFAAADKFDGQMKDLAASFETAKLKAAEVFLPFLVDTLMPFLIDTVGPALVTTAKVVTALGTAFSDSVAFLTEWGAALRDGVGAAVDYVTGKFQALLDFLDRIITKATDVKNAIVGALTYQVSPGARPNGGGSFGLTGGSPQGELQEMFLTGARGAGTNSTGAAAADGLVNGFKTQLQTRLPEIGAAVDQIPQTAREHLQVQSPSVVMAEIGRYVGEGLANGIAQSQGLVTSAVGLLSGAAVSSTDGMVNDVLSGLDVLFQGSKEVGAGIALVSTLIGAAKELEKGTFGFLSAARVIAQGLAFVKGIKGAKKGGGGATAAGGGGAAAQVPTTTFNLTYQNDPFGYSERTARALAAQVNAAQQTGAKVLFNV